MLDERDQMLVAVGVLVGVAVTWWALHAGEQRARDRARVLRAQTEQVQAEIEALRLMAALGGQPVGVA